MPEGHTLHRIARDLQPLVGGRVRASSPQGRFADGAARIDGSPLEAARAHGKHLLLDFPAGHVHVHLGMRGVVFESDPDGTPGKGVRLRLVPDAGGPAWDLAAPTTCELLDDAAADALVARLGPDPLRGDDPAPAFDAIRGSDRPIAVLLLDQEVISGVGNVFRAEALHACGLHPSTPGRALGDGDLACLWTTLVDHMLEAVEAGTIRPGGRAVYKQDTCAACGGPVRAWDLSGRTAYACERCQPA
jgi:endonuclease VIII